MSAPTSRRHGHPIDADGVSQARARMPGPGELARLTSLLSLMADPVRLRVLYALDVTAEMCVGDLALALEVNEDQVSYALRLLRSAGLVRTRRAGRVMFNRLAEGFPEPLREHCLHRLAELAADAPELE